MTTSPQPPLQRVKGVQFTHQTIVLDGFLFEDCEFIGCNLSYSGGNSATVSCHIHPDTTWQIQGQASVMMQVLQEYGWRFEYGIGEHPEPIRFPSDAM
jgi:hypothetical protein